jgi:hypothetical protein
MPASTGIDRLAKALDELMLLLASLGYFWCDSVQYR